MEIEVKPSLTTTRKTVSDLTVFHAYRMCLAFDWTRSQLMLVAKSADAVVVVAGAVAVILK